MTDHAREHAADDKLLTAHDVMTPDVIAVGPETSTRDIARLLMQHRISAVPVVDQERVPIGMVSEGDLIGRDEDERLARRDWWLTLAATDPQQADALVKQAQAPNRIARAVMSAPLVTVTESTPCTEIARLLVIHHIKRVPVVREGRIVGIVSRADLLRVVAAGSAGGKEGEKEPDRGFLVKLFGHYHRPAWEVVPIAHPPSDGKPADPPPDRLDAAQFSALVEDFHEGESRHHDQARQEAAKQRQKRAKELIDAHVYDDAWRELLHHARLTAEAGGTEFMLLRFPNQLVTDGGRAINVAEPGWPATLRGEAAELYLRWERDLKARGFRLSARVLEFPDGKPGDIGLFLQWK